MKMLKYIGLFIIMFIPVIVNADSSLSINCNPKELAAGASTTCTISGTSDSEVDTIEFNISYAEILTKTSFTANSSWEVTENTASSIKVSIVGEEAITGSLNIGTLVFKALDEASASQNNNIELNNIKFINEENETTIANANDSITIKEAETPEKPLLNSIVVNGGKLSPDLSDDKFLYHINLNSSEVNEFSIIAKPKNNEHSISAINTNTNDSVNLNNIHFNTGGEQSNMSIYIYVVSSTDTTTYEIIISKPSPPEAGNPELSSIKIGDTNIDLIDNVYNYTVTLSDVTEYNVTATLKDSQNYKFDDSFLAPPFSLSGEKEFFLRIVPISSTSSLKSANYTFTIKKTASGSSSASVTPRSSSSNSARNENPNTGSTTTVVVAFILIISLIVSFYLYRKNIAEYN